MPSHRFTPDELAWYKAGRKLLRHIQSQGINTFDFRAYQVCGGGDFDGPQWKKTAMKQFGFAAPTSAQHGRWATYAEITGLTGQPLNGAVEVLNPPEEWSEE